jgi:hypothetical protein
MSPKEFTIEKEFITEGMSMGGSGWGELILHRVAFAGEDGVPW